MTLKITPLTFQPNQLLYWDTMVESDLWWFEWHLSGGLYNVIYLQHQWSDQAHTLQFDSTDEYFETVEYEPHSPLELRDSSRKPLIFLDRSHRSNTTPTVWDTVENLDFPKKSGVVASIGPSSELRWSWMTKRWLSASNCDPCSTFSTFLEP